MLPATVCDRRPAGYAPGARTRHRLVTATGHVAFGLLFALPAWFVWRRRVSAVFVGLVALISPLPDADLYLSEWFPGQFHHHGVTHTVLFAVLAGLVAGLAAAALLTRPVDDWLGWERFDRWSMFAFASLAFFLGVLSHVFADMLSAPDISTPIEPLWPVVEGSWGYDLIYFSDPLFNGVFLVAVAATHLAVALLVDPLDHRYRFGGRTAP